MKELFINLKSREKFLNFSLMIISMIMFFILRYLIPNHTDSLWLQILIIWYHASFFFMAIMMNSVYGDLKIRFPQNTMFYKISFIFLDVFFSFILIGFIITGFIAIIPTIFSMDVLQGKATTLDLYNKSIVQNIVESVLKGDFTRYKPLGQIFLKAYLIITPIVLVISRVRGGLNNKKVNGGDSNG